MIVGVDKNQLTGTHAYSNRWKHSQMEKAGAQLMPLRLPFGDYIEVTPEIQALIDAKGGPENVNKSDLLSVVKLSIDTKKNLVEVCQNVCQGHERFKKELLKPMQQADARLVLLIEETDIETLEDVYFWDNPRLKQNPKATKGSSLYKSLCTIREEYNVDIVFCRRNNSGKKILELLEGGRNG